MLEQSIPRQIRHGPDQPPCFQINEMREDIARCRTVQRNRDRAVDLGDNVSDPARSRMQGRANLGLSLQPVRSQLGYAARCVRDSSTMTRIEHPRPLQLKHVQRPHIGRKIPVGRRNKRTGPTHHMIAAEHSPAPAETQVIAEMPWCPDGVDPVLSQWHDLPIGQGSIRPECQINPFPTSDQTGLSQRCHPLRAPGTRIPERQNRRTRHV